MAIHVVRLGTPRSKDEGIRLGTVRRPPRGVTKSEYARRDFFDVWLPELAPSAELVSNALAMPWTPERWKQFVRRYRREMNAPHAKHLIAMLAALSHQTNVSIGCYCADAERCHRSILSELLIASGADVHRG